MAEDPTPGAQGAKLTVFGKLLTVVLILGLLGLGGWLVMIKMNPNSGGGGRGPGGSNAAGPTVEAPDASSITTVKEYKIVPGGKLPPVKGSSTYKWSDNDKTLRFTYNVWSGWLPVIAANHGTKANTDSIFYKKYGFKVEMVLMDDPVAARDAFVSGDVQTLWGTVDMMVLFAQELMRDSRHAPRIVQQIDWSNGGDGIVTRTAIHSVKDLRGKTIVYAQNSPSEYYVTSLLLSAGLKPADVKSKYTDTAFGAATAFVSDKNIDGCVSWSPDIYNIADRVAGTRILSSTTDANKLIADVYAIRADFAKDHPDIVKGLVAGIFEGMDLVKKDPGPPCQLMAEAFSMKAEDVMKMRNDAHPTNFAENVQFLLNASNPTNFEQTWKSASYVYRSLGRIDAPVDYDNVLDATVVKALQDKGLFADQKDESKTGFTPALMRNVSAEAPILTATIRINFFPNSSNPYELARDELGNAIPGKLYDPNVTATMEQVARLTGKFDRCIISIDGHTDSSMKGRVPEQAVKDLSLARADAIKKALIEKYKFAPDKFSVEGYGWDRPANPEDPGNQAFNRRVEISVYPPEQK